MLPREGSAAGVLSDGRKPPQFHRPLRGAVKQLPQRGRLY
nr:MAG TPA_asm: hypothetical protein [Caudoviricetes sp.]